jgi:hypothetical protein
MSNITRLARSIVSWGCRSDPHLSFYWFPFLLCHTYGRLLLILLFCSLHAQRCFGAISVQSMRYFDVFHRDALSTRAVVGIHSPLFLHSPGNFDVMSCRISPRSHFYGESTTLLKLSMRTHPLTRVSRLIFYFYVYWQAGGRIPIVSFSPRVPSI